MGRARSAGDAMSYTIRAGFRLLFWLSNVLVDPALTDEQRADLRAIVASFSNESLNSSEKR